MAIDYKRALEIAERVIQSEEGASIEDYADVMYETRDDISKEDRALLKRALRSIHR